MANQLSKLLLVSFITISASAKTLNCSFVVLHNDHGVKQVKKSANVSNGYAKLTGEIRGVNFKAELEYSDNRVYITATNNGARVSAHSENRVMLVMDSRNSNDIYLDSFCELK